MLMDLESFGLRLPEQEALTPGRVPQLQSCEAVIHGDPHTRQE
jgi:hypothetical protein